MRQRGLRNGGFEQLSLVEDIPAVEDQAATEARSLTSVGKALAILDVFQDAPWTLGVTEVAHRAHLPKSTTFRLLTSLERCGYVERREESYCLGKRLFELGNQVAWCRPRRLREIAVPYMCDLFETAKQTVHLAVLDGPDVLYIEKLHGHKPSPAPTQVGGRVSARTTALGKAMLAHCDRATVDIALLEPPALRTPYTIVLPHLFLDELAEIRRTGVAFDREEVRVGLTCVAAPILQMGRPVGALSVTGSTSTFDPHTMGRRVTAAAHGIAAQLH